jgi:hypothetical protein
MKVSFWFRSWSVGLMLCYITTGIAQSGACFDTIIIKVQDVKCFSHRDGLIRIDSVHGGDIPFYFSLDGETFSTRPEFERLWAGDYTITIRSASGCMATQDVTVKEPPILSVMLESSKNEVQRGEVFTLTAEVNPSTTVISKYEWRPPDLFANPESLVQQVQISYDTPFSFGIADTSGCTAQAQTFVKVQVPDMYFPNIIKIGSNQDAYFTLFCGDGVKQINLMQVYGREGALLFERTNFFPNDPLLGWGGFYNGQKVESGVYLWTTIIQYWDDRKERISGTLTVLR